MEDARQTRPENSSAEPVASDEKVADFRVSLDIFNGPLDLLLHLIKRDELDITDIPIHQITQAYLEYLTDLRAISIGNGFDINIAGDFLLMAATLMEIKSSMLVPQYEDQTPAGAMGRTNDLIDPRLDLVRQLLEYKRLKDNAALLERHQTIHNARFPRVLVLLGESNNEPPPLDLDEVQIWDLFDAFSRLMTDIGTRGPREHEVVYDETPLDLHSADIEDRLRREKNLTLRQLMFGRTSKSEMIGLFLALLELVREKRVTVGQNSDGEIEIQPASAEHRAAMTGNFDTSHVSTSTP